MVYCHLMVVRQLTDNVSNSVEGLFKVKTVPRYTSCILKNVCCFLEYVDHDMVKRKKKK